MDWSRKRTVERHFDCTETSGFDQCRLRRRERSTTAKFERRDADESRENLWPFEVLQELLSCTQTALREAW